MSQLCSGASGCPCVCSRPCSSSRCSCPCPYNSGPPRLFCCCHCTWGDANEARRLDVCSPAQELPRRNECPRPPVLSLNSHPLTLWRSSAAAVSRSQNLRFVPRFRLCSTIPRCRCNLAKHGSSSSRRRAASAPLTPLNPHVVPWHSLGAVSRHSATLILPCTCLVFIHLLLTPNPQPH
jgi:hypothetical protein